jgi:hypothetical protein
LGGEKANVRQRVGYFDDNNGIFFQQTNGNKRWVIRSSVSGTPVDTEFASQTDWNIDKLNGEGPSGGGHRRIASYGREETGIDKPFERAGNPKDDPRLCHAFRLEACARFNRTKCCLLWARSADR